MTLGLGIFLSTVVIATLLLYRWTGNHWNWNKIRRRALTIVGVFAFSGVLLAIAVMTYDRWQSRAKVITSLKGVSLGDKLSEVAFRHGSFEKQLKNVDSVEQYEDEEYHFQTEVGLQLGVREGVVTTVAYICNKESDSTALNRVLCGDSGDKVKDLFPTKLRVLCHKNNKLMRVFDVVEYGTRYFVRQNRIEGFLVTSIKVLESSSGFKWEPCK